MGKVIISLTMDWEGLHLRGIKNVLTIRKVIGTHIPCTHFICPAYFINRKHSLADKMKQVIFPWDEIALHVHPYYNFIKEIPDIPFRHTPNYYSRNTIWHQLLPPMLLKKFHYFVSGRGVPISAYTGEEVYALLDYAKQLLMEAFELESVNGFRAGGWILNDPVLEILAKLKFLYDSSAVPPEILNNGYSKYETGSGRDDYNDGNGEFTSYISTLWGHQTTDVPFLENKTIHRANNHEAVTRYTLPYFIDKILEMPANGGLTDFASLQKTLRPMLNHGLRYVAQNPERNFFINTGFHQEGELKHKLPLLHFIKSLTETESGRIAFKTVSEATELVA